jgi:hypothetical protein
MESNNQPEIPSKLLGEVSGKVNREYQFSSSTTDSDGDELWYF